jgi:hypothetical protein
VSVQPDISVTVAADVSIAVDTRADITVAPLAVIPLSVSPITAEVVADPEVREVTVVGAPGPMGPKGADGSGIVSLTKTAAEAIGGHRVVRASGSGEVSYASSDQLSHQGCILGITTGAVALGADVDVVVAGEVTEPSWQWTLGSVYLGVNGLLTQTPPSTGFLQIIGTATEPTKLLVAIEDTIKLH